MDKSLLKELFFDLNDNFDVFFEKIIEYTNPENILKQSKTQNTNYYLEFKKIAFALYEKEFNTSSKKKMKFITSFLKHKFLLGSDDFNKDTYMQSAGELSVINFFLRNFNNDFEYEPKNVNGKESECRVKYKNFKFNIEVKCPTIKEIESLKAVAYHRTAEKGMRKFVDKVNTKKEGFINEVKRREEALFDYLSGANEKFLDENEGKEINILFVCLDEAFNFDLWEVYLVREVYGYFGENPEHINQEKYGYDITSSYDKVDLVVFSNLFNSHYYCLDNPVINPWSLEKHFNLIYTNSHRRIDNKFKRNGIIQFRYEILNNLNHKFIEFKDKKLKKDNQLFIPSMIWQFNQTLKNQNLIFFNENKRES